MLEQANAGLAQLNGKLRAELSALKAQQAEDSDTVRRICDLFGIGIDTALRYAYPARVDRPVDDGGDSAG